MSGSFSIITPLIENLEKAVNKALEFDIHTQEKLAELSGKVFLIDVKEINIQLYLLPESSGLSFSLQPQEQVDVTIKGRPSALAGLVLNRDGGAVVFPKELEIKGDINLAQRLQTILRGLELDWEEYLSQWMGDTAAHKFGNLLRDTGRFLKQARESLKQDTSDYLRFEKEVLPDQLLIDEFVRGVDDLRNDAERLKQRIERLQNN